MKTRITITKLIAITMAVAAMVVGGSFWTTKAQHVRTFTNTGIVGFITGQSLCFSVGNLSTPGRGSEPIRAQVTLYDAQGNEVARSQEVEVPSDQFRTIVFNHDDLPRAGTGRELQRYDFQFSPVGAGGGVYNSAEQFPASWELVDNDTGSTILMSPLVWKLRNSNSPG